MDFQQLKRKLLEHTWWSEECPGKWQYCYWANAAVLQQERLAPGLLSICCVTYQDAYLNEKTSEQEKLDQYYWVQQQYRENKGTLDELYNDWSNYQKQLLPLIYSSIADSEGWDTTELLQLYSELITVAIEYAQFAFFIECIDVYGEQVLPDLCKKEAPELSDVQRTDMLVTLTTPAMVSFMEEYQVERCKLILNYQDQLDPLTPEARAAIQELHAQYEFITVNYGGSPALQLDQLVQQIQEDATQYSTEEFETQILSIRKKIENITEQQAAIEAAHDFTQEFLDDLSIFRTFGAFIDERKETMVKTSFAIQTLLHRISAVTSVSMSALEWYTIDEIKTLLQDGSIVDSSIVQDREECSVFMTEYVDGQSELTIYTGEEAQQLIDIFNTQTSDRLHGMVASSGEQELFTGTVQVVTNTALQEFTTGNILVTSMTRPDFVPLMKKAAAIVTDEGGITSHAAVVSRELGIPCIIGTKHATKVLQDGDTVTMNLHTGEVEKQ